MEKLPLHESECPWGADAIDDYWAAPDDLRRDILLKSGYDPSLRSDAERLFPPPAKKEKPQKDWSKIAVFVSIIIFIASVIASFLIARFV